jgi:hypothetical protein
MIPISSELEARRQFKFIFSCQPTPAATPVVEEPAQTQAKNKN